MANGIIAPKTYKRLLGLIFGLFVISCLLSALVLYKSLHIRFDHHFGATVALIARVKDTLVTKTILINLVFYLLTAVGLALLGIVYSHRIAGPLFRVELYAARLAEGRFEEKIGFRKNDAVHPLSSVLNELAAACHDRQKCIECGLQALEHGLLLAASLPRQSKEKIELIKRLRKLDCAIRAQNQKIKV